MGMQQSQDSTIRPDSTTIGFSPAHQQRCLSLVANTKMQVLTMSDAQNASGKVSDLVDLSLIIIATIFCD